MVQVRDLVIGGGNFAVESGPAVSDSNLGLNMQVAGAMMEKKVERDADAYNIKAETDLQLYGVEALQKTINEVDDPEQITEKFFEVYKSKYDQLIEAAPNSLAKQKLAKAYEGYRGSFGQRAILAQAEEAQSKRLNGVYDSVERYQSAIINGTIPYDVGQKAIRDSVNSADNFLPPSQSAKLKREAKQNTAKLIVSSMPEDAKFKLIAGASGDIKGGFDAAMQMVHANEGGYAASDGASGQPVMMGINKGSHPKAFEEVMRISETQGKEAAKAYADKFYRETYWDKNKIGELPENVQVIVMDGVVNHWSGFQKQLVAAAKSGKSPEELIKMRRDEYARLANEPGKEGDYPWKDSAEGWDARMDNIEAGLFGKTGTAIDDLSISDKVGVMKDVQRYVVENEKLRVSDYGEYARRMGMDVATTIKAQEDRPFVQVVPKEEAKQIVDQLKQYTNSDDFINFTNQFSQRYAGGEDYAIGNLVNANLPPEMEQAFFMAKEDPNGNKGYIDAIFKASLEAKANDGGIDGAIKRIGKKPSDIMESVTKAYLNTELPQLNKFKFNRGAAFKTDRQIRAIESIAQGYLLNNPDKDADDAVEYAMTAFDKSAQYKMSNVDGQPYLIPTAGRNPQKADDISARMKEFYSKSLELQMAIKEKGTFFNKNVYPVLNDDESGYTFVDVTGEPVYIDAAKTTPLAVSMQQLHNQYTPSMVPAYSGSSGGGIEGSAGGGVTNPVMPRQQGGGSAGGF